MANNNPIGNIPALPRTVADTAALGALIQSERKAQGLTQLDLAGLAGVGNRFIIDLEKGKETIQMQKALDVLQLLGLELVVQPKGRK